MDNNKNNLRCYTREYPDLKNTVYVEEIHKNPRMFILRNLFSDAELDNVKKESEDEVN